MPVPDTRGEEWDRLPQEPALSVLMALALQGEFAGIIPAQTPVAVREALELRAAAVTAFEVCQTLRLSQSTATHWIL
jgi:intracellular protein transport protein USO1